MDIEIRRAVYDDVERILEIARMLQLQGQREDRQGSTTGFLVSGYDKRTYDEQVEQADHFYVACDPETDQPIGFMLAYSERLIGKGEEVNQQLKRLLSSFVVIKQIAVDPNYGRRGVAGRLYDHVKARLGGTGRTQLVAAVVNDPPNEVSARFHRKQGFSPMVELDGPDGRCRLIWRYSVPQGDPEVLNAQYDRAIQLYLHEDTLNWEKLRNYVYITVAMVAAGGFLLEESFTDPTELGVVRGGVVLVICVLGLLLSIGYSVALWSGIKFQRAHKESVTLLEDQYIAEGGIRLLPYRSRSVSVVGRNAPTTYLLQYTPVVGMVVWLVTFAGVFGWWAG